MEQMFRSAIDRDLHRHRKKSKSLIEKSFFFYIKQKSLIFP